LVTYRGGTIVILFLQAANTFSKPSTGDCFLACNNISVS